MGGKNIVSLFAILDTTLINKLMCLMLDSFLYKSCQSVTARKDAVLS